MLLTPTHREETKQKKICQVIIHYTKKIGKSRQNSVGTSKQNQELNFPQIGNERRMKVVC